MSIHTANDDFAAVVQAEQQQDRAYALPMAMQELGAALERLQRDIGAEDVGIVTDAISDMIGDYIADAVFPNDSLRASDAHAAAMRSLERGLNDSRKARADEVPA